MLFIVFINDIVNITANGVFTKLCADDFKLYTSLTSLDDCHNLQVVLSNLLSGLMIWLYGEYHGKRTVLYLRSNLTKFICSIT